jgi:hypothetical protein
MGLQWTLPQNWTGLGRSRENSHLAARRQNPDRTIGPDICPYLPYPDADCHVTLRCNMPPSSDHRIEHSVGKPLAHPADDRVSAPPQVFRSKVYRAKQTEDWIVEPPRDRVSVMGKMVFTGPRAQQLALTFAYETFGNARFFPY